MLPYRHRVALLFLCTATWLISMTLVQPSAPAQVPDTLPTGPPEQSEGAIPDAFSLPTDRAALRKLHTAEDYIKVESWAEALKVLQSMLDAPEDVFFVPEKPDRPKGQVKSARAAAETMLGGISAKGLAAYQTIHGDAAQGRLASARREHDGAAIEDIARRYFHTKAGFDAALDLAMASSELGRPAAAAAYYSRLLHHRDAAKLSSLHLLQAATAFHLAGDMVKEDQAWKKLTAKLDNRGLELSDKTCVSVEQLRDEVHRLRTGSGLSKDWPLFRADAAHSGETRGGAPLLEPRYLAATIFHDETKSLYYRGLASLESAVRPVLPAFFPITVGNKLIYRGGDGLHAVDLDTFRPAWSKPAELRLAIDKLFLEFTPRWQLTDERYGYGWWPRYVQDWQVIFQNSTIGSLSADSRRVYAVDDLPIPPHPGMILENEQMQQAGQRPRYNFGTLADDVQHNRLRAFDIDTGDLLWEAGGKTPAAKKGGPLSSLHDSFFLGPPLPLDGKLYVLVERSAEVRLACLDPASGRALWLQPLASSTDKIAFDVARRIRALHLAHDARSGGALICPTGTGTIVAVDPITRALLWSHSYRDKSLITQNGYPNPYNGFLSRGWHVSAPIIHEGKLFFAGCDCDSVRCIDLHDGSLLWQSPATDEDCYLAAIHKNTVLLAGRSTCRALELASGKELWRQNTGLPSGQGVQDGKSYYLPVGKRGVCVIDLETAGEPSFIEPRTPYLPGNLLFHRSNLISQNINSIAVYPQAQVRLGELELALARSPKDPLLLAERAFFRLDKGELLAAIDDLHDALEQQFPQGQMAVRDKARARLFDALTRLLRDDFAKGEKFLDEYRRLSQVEASITATPREAATAREEQEKRRLLLLCVIARGREQQGRLVDALDQYEGICEISGDADRLLALDATSVEIQPRLWAAQRIAELLARCPVEKRAALDQALDRRWSSIQSSGNIDALERFVDLFGPITHSGKVARLALAERLLQHPEREQALEAERHLVLLTRERDEPELAARALDALARLMARKGLLDDAIEYHRRLARDYPKTVVRDGKTGATLLEELQSDKRFLPFLTAQPAAWGKARFQVSEAQGSFPQRPWMIEFSFEGDVLPSLKQSRLALDTATSRLRLLETANGRELWNQAIKINPALLPALQQISGVGMRVPCQVRGHLALMNLGHLIVALDLFERRILWQRIIPIPPNFQPMPSFNQENVVFALSYPDQWMQRVGETGPVRSPHLCLQTRQGIQLVDAIRGTTLWNRTDITTPVEMFGDDDRVFLVENRPDGTALHGSRALRLRDGTSISVPDFSAHYQTGRRLETVGGFLLLFDSDNDKGTLRLYDVANGKDLWQRKVPARTVLLRSEISGLAGTVEPDGKTTLFDLFTRQAVLQLRLDPDHLKDVDQITLFGDPANLYFALHAPSDNVAVMGEPGPNWQGPMRSAAVNGPLYAFDRATGKLRWFHLVDHQFIMLDQQEDLPILVCCSVANRCLVPGNAPMNLTATRFLDKRTGKLLYAHEAPNTGQHTFHTMRIDRQSGAIELITMSSKIRIAQPAP
jgi:outer membrane protein assembly factor BamB